MVISTKFVKVGSPALIGRFSIMFNKSIQEGAFPDLPYVNDTHFLLLHHDDLLITLSHLKFEFHVIALTEHKIRHSMPIQNIEIPGYHEFIYDSSETTHAGIKTLCLHKSLTYKIRNDLKLVPPHPGIFESTFIEIILPDKKNLIIGCIYRPFK